MSCCHSYHLVRLARREVLTGLVPVNLNLMPSPADRVLDSELRNARPPHDVTVFHVLIHKLKPLAYLLD
jgi:hypothetical protein